jgi:hypothetical protein
MRRHFFRSLLERPYLPQQLLKQAVTADNRLLALQSAHTLNHKLCGGIYG